MTIPIYFDSTNQFNTHKYKKYIIQTTRSDRIIYLHLKIFRHLDFSSEIAIFVLSCKEIRRPRRRNGQAGARPCKMTVGDAGTEAEKPSQFVDIHRAYIRTEAPLSALFSPRKRTFFGLFAANKSILTCLSTPYIKRSQSLPKQGSSEKGTLSIYQSVYMADLNVYR